MRVLNELLANRVLWVAVVGWFVAQALKVVFTYIIERRWDFGRFFGLGGMPSSHSAVVCGVATAVGIARGFYSIEFTMAFVTASVVMTDAAGVRRAAGKQAVVLNKIVQDMVAGGLNFSNEALKELLGHTPFEVLMGALLGVLLAVLIM
ncbi:divergent PAP2 family protein [Bacillota bacterium Meth-B3]|nr:divergent PAP2 family protein [Christensenellaceae bacterium]MEA5066571.1 divergent PAP2 family protein [Eubacteriales bacterium]MEA5069277.1 divergent PAP2 family protein [Christensenellaceae bacterium]